MIKSIFIVIAWTLTLQSFAQSKDPEQKEMNTEARKNVSGNFIQLSDGITHYEKAGDPKNGVIVHLNAITTKAL